MNLTLSYSQIATFLDCRKKYFLKYKKNLVSKIMNPNFIFGNAIHEGIRFLYEKKNNYLKLTLKNFEKEKDKARKNLIVSAENEQKLIEQESVIRGLLPSYQEHYKTFLKNTEHLKNEYKATYKIDNNIKITIKLDNLIKIKKDLYIHELKTTKVLTTDYVKNVKNDLQTNIYFYIHNIIENKNKVKGILYDIVKKPGIRLKQNESEVQYLNRLYEYYKDGQSFHMEQINIPLLSKDRIFSIIKGVGKDIINCSNNISSFYPNERYCYVWSRCEYYDICHIGENKETLSIFTNRKES